MKEIVEDLITELNYRSEIFLLGFTGLIVGQIGHTEELYIFNKTEQEKNKSKEFIDLGI